MAIINFSFACALDDVPAYCTYEKDTMLIIQSKSSAKKGLSDFQKIEKFIPALISHESIHVVIASIVNNSISESLDTMEVIVEVDGRKFQVSINNILFANDDSGLVFW